MEIKKVLDVFNEIGVFNELDGKHVTKNKDEAISFFYKYRIYLIDILYEVKFLEYIHDLLNDFLEKNEYDGNEFKNWDKFLELEVK